MARHARIGFGVGHQQRLALFGHQADDPFAKPDLIRTNLFGGGFMPQRRGVMRFVQRRKRADHDAGTQGLLPIDDENRAGLGVGRLDDVLGDDVQRFVQIDFAGDFFTQLVNQRQHGLLLLLSLQAVGAMQIDLAPQIVHPEQQAEKQEEE